MCSIDHYFANPETTIKDVLQIIENSDGKIALLVDKNRTLLGTVTDGDVRRGILNSFDLNSPASEIMNKSPLKAYEGDDKATLFSVMQAKRVRNIPIVNTMNQVVDLANMSDMIIPDSRDNWVVIMAGGIGSRLRPLTNDTPKPMLPIKGAPVMEILIKTFISQGFHRFYLSVNYLADQIKDHFGNGEKYGIEIRYLEENMPLGTGGALSLLHHKPKDPFIVINGDIVTNVKFSDMLDFHNNEKADITMGVREHSVHIPYGVVDLEGHKICKFIEKPTEQYFVNTGIYIANPNVLEYVPENTAFTMPDLMKKAQKNQKSIQAFPVTESWLDIGRMEDFAKAENLVDEIERSHKKFT